MRKVEESDYIRISCEDNWSMFVNDMVMTFNEQKSFVDYLETFGKFDYKDMKYAELCSYYEDFFEFVQMKKEL